METTETKIEWLKQFEKEIIPWAEKLREKELEHNRFLKESRTKMESRMFAFFIPWKSEAHVNLESIGEMIRYSDNMLRHFDFRISEYKEFVKQRKKEYGINN
jgi:hypothetical protein